MRSPLLKQYGYYRLLGLLVRELERDELVLRLAERLEERDGEVLMDDLDWLGEEDDRLGDEKLELREELRLGLDKELDRRDELEDERDDRVENEGDRLVLLELDEKDEERFSLLELLDEDRLGEMSIVPRLLDLEDERLGEE